jgi:glycosyltransferase involved in cell wall biosynthesis
MAKNGKITVALLWKVSTGTGTSVNDLAAALDTDRFEVIFIFLGGPVTTPAWMKDAGYKVFYLCPRREIGFRGAAVLLKLARILRSHRVDVLHCHNHKANVYGALAGILARTPIVLAQVHGLRRARNTRRRLMNLIVFRKARRILAVADAVKKDVVDSNWYVAREKLLVLENSVDYNRFAEPTVSPSEARQLLGIPPEAVVFGTIGRLAPTKGLSYLIEAFSVVKQQLASAQLVLLGDGPSREELEQCAARTPHREAIHFLGYQPNVAQLLRGMDVFVLSSVAEGMPRVILEAMVSGVPCVSTAVGGIPQMLDHGAIGMLVPSRDSQGLARAMLAWVDMAKQERDARITKAREHARRHYSHDVLTDRLAELYENEFAARKSQKGNHGGKHEGPPSTPEVQERRYEEPAESGVQH